MKFIKYSKIWFAISLLVIVLGVFGMVMNKRANGSILSYGIDFTGGSVMELDFDETNLKTDLKDQAFTDNLASVFESQFPESTPDIRSTNEGTYTIQSKSMSEEMQGLVSAAITEEVGPFELIRLNNIGPKVGASLKNKAIVALSLALVAIVLYIAYAFRKVPKKVSPWKFGFSAIVALAHDIVITLGIFALLGYEVDIFFITALLTIMGFSVHDTIVVFDRIRENLKRQGRDDTFGDIADISLRQTMSRSINTSLSTLFPLLALYFFGSPSIRVFIFALIVGIVVGTYSSIFIASPVLTFWQEKARVR